MTDIAPEKVIINGVEYDPSDAQQLVELGSKTRDFEKQWNTDLTKVMPDYTRATQELSTTKKELEARDLRIKEFEDKARQAETPAEKTNALKAARELGLLDDESASKKFLTREELDTYFTTKRKEEQDSQYIVETGKKFESEIDGSDGRLPYNSKAVLAYATQFGFFKSDTPYDQALKNAYEEMAGGVNEKWKEAQIEAARSKGLTTLKGKGSQAPTERKIDSEEDAKVALNEILWGGQE